MGRGGGECSVERRQIPIGVPRFQVEDRLRSFQQP